MKKIHLSIFLFFVLYGVSIATTYYSKSSGNWNKASNWNTLASGSGTNHTGIANEAGNIFIIQSSHNITLNMSVTLASITATAGGKITRTNDAFNFSGTVTINSGCSYVHGIDGGTIPSYVWNSGSICNIQGINGAISLNGINQVFSNLIWNSNFQASPFDLGNISDVTGTLTIQNAGNGVGGVTFGSSTAKTITGSLNVQDLLIISNNQNTKLTIGGNVDISSSLYLSNASNTGSLEIKGKFTWASGEITAPNGGIGNIIFSKSGTQLADFPASQFYSGDNINLIVNSSSTLDITNSSNNISLNNLNAISIAGTLLTGATTTLDLAESGATFNLASGGILSIDNPGGVSSAITNSGSGTLIFNNNASYIIGGGALGLLNTTMKNLTINTNPVTLSGSDLSITGIFTLGNTFYPTNRNIYLGGNLNGSGSLAYGSGSSTFIFTGNTVISSSLALRQFTNILVTGSLTAPSTPNPQINLSGNFINNGTFTHSGGIIYLSGTLSTLDGVDFYDLNTSAFGMPTVIYNNTIGIAGTWTLSATLPTLNGTINFNGVGAQTINSITYKNLQTGGSGTKSLAAATNVLGNINIGNGSTLSTSASNYALSITGSLTNSGTFSPNASNVSISGNFTNSNTFTPGSSTIVFTGFNAQTLAGNTSFNNLSINKPTGGNVTITSGANMQTIQGYLIINSLNGSNKLNTNGNLTLYSDQSTTASLIDNNSNSGSGGSVNGNVTVQRSHKGAGDTHIFGTPITSSNVFTIGQGAYNVLLYSEDGLAPYPRVTNTYNGSYRRVTLGGTNLTVGRGYSIRKDAPGTLNFSGVPNNGNIGISATYTASGPPGEQGWNMLSNPYPSAINWASVGNTCGAATSGVSIWNGSTYTATAVIPSGVGFFIQATMNGTITFHNSDRIGSGTSNSTVYRSEEESKWFYLNVSNAGGGPTDAFAATFNNDATSGFESNYDITKPYVASGPFMYSRVNGKRLSLSVVPYPDTETKIPITLQVYANATYRFTTSSFSDWYSDYAVFLKDSTSSGSQLIDLSKIAYYDFTKNTNDADTASRFSLIFKYQPGVNTITGPNTFTGGNPGTVTGTDFPTLLSVGVPEDELFVEVINTTPGITAIDKEDDNETSSKVYTLGSNIYINFGSNLSKSDIAVCDIVGRVIYEASDVESKGKKIIPIWQADKSSIYIVKVRNNREFITKRVVFN